MRRRKFFNRSFAALLTNLAASTPDVYCVEGQVVRLEVRNDAHLVLKDEAGLERRCPVGDDPSFEPIRANPTAFRGRYVRINLEEGSIQLLK